MADTLARITQETLEVIGPDAGYARITQESIEAIGPVASPARVTQEYIEAIGPSTPLDGRITQLYLEPIGPPISAPLPPARITQLVIEALGLEIPVPCILPTAFRFHGDATGLFYQMRNAGAESVPIALADTYVTIDDGHHIAVSQTLTVEETWIDWQPGLGALQIKFSSGNPVRTLWMVTNLARAMTPLIPVWASAYKFDLWKQECIS